MAERFSAYLPGIRERWLQEQRDWQVRRARAWESARRIAELLRTDFGATEIIAFGSMVRTGRYDERSDIDLAVTGVPDKSFFKASAAADAISEFELDLVDLADCTPALRSIIQQEGVAL